MERTGITPARGRTSVGQIGQPRKLLIGYLQEASQAKTRSPELRVIE